MIRFLDMLLAITGLLISAPLMMLLFLLVWLDTRSPIFRQVRLGRFKRKFTLIKFRTMRLDTLDMPTHLVSTSAVTPLGRFLRGSKLDELPQLWNVLRGDMSLVGPRPGLPNHRELVLAREIRGVFAFRPGITGLAQLRGIDMSNPVTLARTDAVMLRTLNIKRYLGYIILTVIGYGRGDRLKH